MYRYIVLNGIKYAVQQGTYKRSWARQFTATLSANIVELNFVDKGPGIQTYDMTLALQSWPVGSELHNDGITQTVLQQMAALEADYLQVATPITFIDPLGNPPQAGTSVYFTDLQQTFPNEATVENPIILVTIELIAAVPAIS